MQIEEGKYYKTRDGRKVGPMVRGEYGWKTETDWQFNHYGKRWPDSHQLWNVDGSVMVADKWDGVDVLVSEWPTGPVVTETVTKTHIVPGTYDGVDVGDPRKDSVSIDLRQYMTPDELDAAAAVLSALAKGLRDVG